MNDTRVFASFDVDHDGDLGMLLSSQGGSGFVVSACSASGAVTDRWVEAARRRIREVDQVIVICGEHTEDSLRVSSELRIAREENKPFFLLWGRRERMCTMPASVARAGCMYSWTREIVMQQVVETQRKSRPMVIPERYKRP